VTSSGEPQAVDPPKATDTPGKTCPACSKPLDDAAVRCPHCGLALGEHQRCPHCHAIADVEISPEARFVCTVCGGVRIPIDDPAVVRSPETLDLLRRATVARTARAIWRIVAAAVVGFGIFSVLVLWLVVEVAHPIFAGAAMGALAALVPFAFGVLSFKKSQERGAELVPLLEKAWTAAATDVARARGGKLDAPAFAKVTRISEAAADKVLSRMSADSLLLSSVTSEGGLLYTLVEDPQKDNAAH
jgi:hypothetical protein